jgi:hypothetical protein
MSFCPKKSKINQEIFAGIADNRHDSYTKEWFVQNLDVNIENKMNFRNRNNELGRIGG